MDKFLQGFLVGWFAMLFIWAAAVVFNPSEECLMDNMSEKVIIWIALVVLVLAFLWMCELPSREPIGGTNDNYKLPDPLL